jgi:hypothetical protein
MNKKVNTLLFVIGASVLNIVLIIIFFILLLALIGALLPETTAPATAQLLMLGAFVLSIALSYGIYGLLIKYISKRIEMEKYFHPIFGKKKR